MLELVEVGGGQAVQAFLAIGGEPDAGKAPVVVVAPSLHQLGRLGAVNQLDGAVMTQQQIAGEIPDGRALRSWVALDRQQQLVLGRCQADLARLGLAPVQEPAQAGPECQQVLVVVLGQLTHIPHDPCCWIPLWNGTGTFRGQHRPARHGGRDVGRDDR